MHEPYIKGAKATQHNKKKKRKLFIYIDDTCGWNVKKSMIHEQSRRYMAL